MATDGYQWRDWRNDRLLDLRLRDLRLAELGSWLDGVVARFTSELDFAGLRYRPNIWLSDEWFSPDGVGGFAVPFYLAHPRLKRLERDQMDDIEGGSISECLRLMRHELGHAIQHSYRVNDDPEWGETFGDPSKPYPERYRPDPASRDYVSNLRYWYGQAHPDEDFAETVAVWLEPLSGWRERYQGTRAGAKLEYVDRLMRTIGPRAPRSRRRRAVDPLGRIDTRMVEHYRARRSRYSLAPDPKQESLLLGLFEPRNGVEGPLSSWLLRLRPMLKDSVAGQVVVARSAFDVVFHELLVRSRRLDLAEPGGMSPELMDLLDGWVAQLLDDSRKHEWISV